MPADETALLYYVSRRLNSDLDINRVLADVLDLTVQRVGASNGSVIVFDETGTVAHKILARAGLPPEKEEAVIAEVLSQGLAGWVVEHKQGAIAGNVLVDRRWISFEDDDLVGGAAVSVPLLRQDHIVGVLTLRHPERDHFTHDHLALLSAVADQAAIAVQNARLFHSVQAERARMEAIISGAGDAILVTDGQGQLLLMNVLARQAFDILEESSFRHQHILDVIPSNALAELWAHRDNTAYPSTGELPLGDGRIFHASLTTVPNVGYVIVMQDITTLKELNEMKTEFVSVVSHDLRSPLQLICTYANMITDAGPLNSQQKEFLNGINRGVTKMSDLIDDLLDLAKIEAGVDMEAEPCHLDQIVSQVVWRFESVARERGLKLQSQLPDHLPPVKASPRRIDQVISNLVDNAIKYTLEGSVTIAATADDTQVTVSVIDTGIGLRPQEQKELFARFYRADNEFTQSTEGTGLGLAIASSIIEQYEGRIWVQSTWQKGSNFSFSLPIDEQG
jgi:signal transduction histidine kinase